MIETELKVSAGDLYFNTGGRGLCTGALVPLEFPPVASLADGVAASSIQTRLYVHKAHRVRGAYFACSGYTAVAAGTDPAADIYKSLPVPDALAAALASPVVAGNVDNGAHDYAVAFYSTAGIGMPSSVVSVTVADKTTNGKVELTNIPIGPAGTTGRKIYRSAAGLHALLLLATIANNTATTYTDNIADGSLGAGAVTADASAATILSSTVKLSSTTRGLADQLISGTLAIDPTIALAPCMYTLRAVTGASTGALANLQAYLLVEYVSA